MNWLRRWWNAHARFALCSLAATVAVSLAAGLTSWALINGQIRSAYGQGALDSVRPVVVSALAGADTSRPLSPFTVTALDTGLRPLLQADGVRGVTLFSPAGEQLYTVRAVGAETGPRLSGDARGTFHNGDSLVAAWRGDGFLLAVDRSYGPVAASLDYTTRVLLAAIIGGSFLLYVVTQALFLWARAAFHREYGKLAYLYQSGRRFAASPDIEDILGNLCRDAAGVTGAHYTLAATIDEDRESELVVRVSHDRKHDVSMRHNSTVKEWTLRRAAVSGVPVMMHHDRSPFPEVLGNACQPGAVFTLCVPLVIRERSIAVLVIARDEKDGPLDQERVTFVQDLAAQAAMSAEQAALFSKVRAYARELEVSYDNTLKALMAALDAKDEDTEGHSERVAVLTLAVARELGVPESRMPDMERGALLHDVGKIGVPDGILRKPASLTKLEWEAMQRHPLLAALMVSGVGFLEGAVPILLYHHERFDGTGYPFGLYREQIPLEARIFAVIDAYDAMMSNRPYREAIGREAAIQEIRDNSGSQFDPQVVEAFLRVLAGGKAREERAAEQAA